MEFESCLDNIQSNDNAIRKAAEQQWNSFKSDSVFILSNLARVLEGSTDAGRRTLAVILLRGLVLREEIVLQRAPSAVFAQFRMAVLSVMLHEELPFVRRQIAHAVAPLARMQEWPELLAALPALATHHDPAHRVLCFFLIDKLAEYIGPFLVESGNLAVVCGLLEPVFVGFSGAVDDLQLSCQAGAACAALSLLHEMPASLCSDTSSTSTSSSSSSAESSSPLQHQLLAATLPFCLHLLQQCMRCDNMLDMRELSDAVGRLVKARPLLFRGAWQGLLAAARDACVGEEGAQRGGVSDEAVKCVLLEALQDLMTCREAVSFCSTREARGLCVGLCLELLQGVELAEDAEELELELERGYLWARLPVSEDSFGDEDGEEGECCLLAASVLSTFLRKWPIEETLGQCLGAVSELFQRDGGSGGARERGALRAALLVTSMLFDLLGKEMQPHLPALVPRLLALVQHPHPRLRLCALLCLKSLVLSDYDQDSQEGFRVNHHQEILPVLLQSIQDNAACPRVCCQGVNTLRAFCDPLECPQEVLLPHSQSILDMCGAVLASRGTRQCPLFLLEECVPLVGNISIVDRDTFAPLYSGFMAMLSSILLAEGGGVGGVGGGGGGLQELKGKCLECCALLGASVGYPAFHADAAQLMEYMLSLQSDPCGFDFSDALASYMVQACARIASVLGNAFAPYLHRVLPVLLLHVTRDIGQCVQTEDQFVFGDGDGHGEGGGGGGFATVYQRGEGSIRVLNNSHAVKEKELSLRALYQYLLDIPRLVTPFLPQVLAAVSSVSPAQCCSEDDVSTLEVIGAIVSDSCKLWLRFSLTDEEAAGALGGVVEAATSYLLAVLQEANQLSLQTGESVMFSAAAVDAVRLTLQVLADSREQGVELEREGWRGVSRKVGGGLFVALRDQVHMWVSRKYRDADTDQDSNGFPGAGGAVTAAGQEEERVEEALWLSLTDSLGCLFRTMALPDAAQLFTQEALPFFLPLLEAGSSAGSEPLLSLLISLLTDVVEAFAADPPLCHSVVELLAPLLFEYAEQGGLAVLCMYGMGACAQHGGEAWSPHAGHAAACLQHCLQAATSPQDDEDDDDDDDDDDEEEEEEEEGGGSDEELTGTIISALFKVAVFCPDSGAEDEEGGGGALLARVLRDMLPLACFPYEARQCHQLLLRLMKSGHPALLGPGGCHLQALFTVLAHLARLFLEARILLSSSSSSSSSSSRAQEALVDDDHEDFWAEQLVAADFGDRVRVVFSGEGGAICGFERAEVLALLGGMPVEHQQALSALLEENK